MVEVGSNGSAVISMLGAALGGRLWVSCELEVRDVGHWEEGSASSGAGSMSMLEPEEALGRTMMELTRGCVIGSDGCTA